MPQRLGKVEKTTKDHRQASLQLAALLKEIEKTVKATQAMQASNAALQNDCCCVQEGNINNQKNLLLVASGYRYFLDQVFQWL